jgi:5'-AMP-activated protein kinase, catalytic alpha subunit
MRTYRMLVVDPMKRITMVEVRKHQWFQHKLPAYLALPPEAIELQERSLDEEIITEVVALNLKGFTEQLIREAASNPTAAATTAHMHSIKVTYELLLDAKRHKLRIADVVLALQDQSRTPPGSGGSSVPKILGLGTSPSSSLGTTPMGHSFMAGHAKSAGRDGHGLSPLAAGTTTTGGSMSTTAQSVHPAAGQDLPSRRRRWYLGIQSKKDPSHVMTEVYKALLSLGCSWHAVTSYRVLVLHLFQVSPSSSSPKQVESHKPNLSGSIYPPQPPTNVDSDAMEMTLSNSLMDLASLNDGSGTGACSCMCMCVVSSIFSACAKHRN